jgi:DNA-binding PadR family transcriptional regulator
MLYSAIYILVDITGGVVPEALKPQWFQILFALAGGPLHGSAIVGDVLERTDGAMKLWPATLYGSLRDLEDAGWIRECDAPDDGPGEGGRRRFHELTPQGRHVVRNEVARLEALVDEARARGLTGDRVAG